MGDLRMEPPSYEEATINLDRLPFIPKSEPSAPTLDNSATTGSIIGWNTSIISKPPLPYPPSLSYPPPPLSNQPQYESTPGAFTGVFNQHIAANSGFYYLLSIAAICVVVFCMLTIMLFSHTYKQYPSMLKF